MFWLVGCGQKTEKVKELIESKDCVILHVPSNINYFQMLDLNVNGHTKEFLKEKFELWYADQVQKRVEASKDTYDIDIPLKLSDLKPIHAKWIIGLYAHLRNNEERVLKSWEMAGLEEAFTMELPPKDPYADLD